MIKLRKKADQAFRIRVHLLLSIVALINLR